MTRGWNLVVAAAMAGLVAGCGNKGAKATPDPAPTEEAPAPEADDGEAAEATADWDDLRTMLQARHPEDLPTRRDLARVDRVRAGLKELVRTDDEAVIRARAASLLGMFDTDGAREFLVEVAADPEQPGTVRAGAIQGLGRMDLSAHAGVRAALIGHAGGEDVRLALEAVMVLKDVPEAADDLARLAADETTPEPVRAALD